MKEIFVLDILYEKVSAFLLKNVEKNGIKREKHENGSSESGVKTMRELLEQFLHAYVKERSLENTMSFFRDDVLSVGTGGHEIGKGFKELENLMRSEFEELPDSMTYEVLDYSEISCAENVKNTFAYVHICTEKAGQALEMKARLTCTFVKEKEEWKISCAHMSLPSESQEENTFFPLHYGKRAAGRLTADTNNKLLELISEALPGGIMGGYLDEGFPLYTVNDRMLEILGYTYEELVLATDEKMLNMIYTEDREYAEKGIREQLKNNNEYEVIYRVVGKNNRLIWINDLGKKIITVDGREALISIMTDISERVKKEELLKFAAERDSLTELYNRKKMMALIEERFEKEENGTLFIGDIDNFKNINDTRGHVVGDAVLRKLSAIMLAYKEELFLACRLGGDEFAIFFYEKTETSAAVEITKEIQEEFRKYVHELLPELKVSMSVGGAVRKSEESLNDLYCRADDALYLAKQNKGTLVML